MTQKARLLFLLYPQIPSFQDKKERRIRKSQELFCSTCGGLKPYCKCNDLFYHLEIIYKEKKSKSEMGLLP